MLIEAINARLPKGSKTILVTNTNVANIARIINAESAGNTAGYLRDNNPFNLNTYSTPHGSLAGGTVVPEFGIYVQKFNSVADGINATASQLLQPNAAPTIAALQNNAPASVFGASLASGAWGGASYANASTFPTLSSAIIQGSGENATTVNPTGTLGQINNTLKNVPGVAGSETVVKDAVGGVTSVAGFIGKITNPSNLKNVGIFMAGMALTVTGLVILFSASKQGKAIEGTAIKAAAA